MSEGYWQGRSRMTSRRGFVRGLAVGAAGLSGAMLLACGGSKDSSSEGGQQGAPPVGASVPTAESVANVPRGGTLKIGMAAQPIYDPHFGFGGGDHQWLYPVFDSLIAYNSKGLLDQSMSVAREWEYVEPTKVLLRLRPDAKIHDTGEPVNAELVKWNLARAMSPRALPRNDLAAISRVDTVDDMTVALTLAQPSAPLLTNLGDRGGFIVSRQMVEKHGENVRLYPTGSGMFRVVDWKQDAHVHLEAVKNHWRKDAQGREMPYTDRIQFQIIPESTVLTAALEGGDVDVAAPSTSETTRLLKSPGRLKAVAFNGSSMTSFSWNHASPPFDNVNFRRGFASAMDRATWIKNFQTGREEECRGVLHPANWAFSKEVEGWKYDPQKAADYLRASGIPREQWVAKFHPADAVDDTEQFWEQNLGEAGIKFQWARPEREGPRLRVQTSQGGDGSSSFYLTGWSMRVDPDANVSAYYVKDGAYNSGGAPTPLTEDLIVKARETLEIDERKKLYTEIQKRALDQVYSHVLMCYTISTTFTQPRVGNLNAYYGGEGKPRYGELWMES